MPETDRRHKGKARDKAEEIGSYVVDAAVEDKPVLKALVNNFGFSSCAWRLCEAHDFVARFCRYRWRIRLADS